MSMLLLLAFLLQDVDALIRQLGSESVAERQQAVEDLVRQGRKALPALEVAARSRDPEVELRAREAMDRIRAGGLFDDRGRDTGDREVDAALKAALDWLARHQATGWVCPACPDAGAKDVEAGLTGLSVLAFLAQGREVGPPARRGLVRLQELQDAEGALGPRSAKFMYGQAIGTLALAEAFGLEGDERVGKAAQRAVDFLSAAQNPGKGWRYVPRSGETDTSVTIWAALALGVALRTGLRVPRESFDGVAGWLREVTEEAYGRVGYLTRHTKCSTIPSLNEIYDHHESMTGGALVLRRMLGMPRTLQVSASGSDLLLRDLPKREGGTVDFYYWHLGTLGLYHQTGGEGKAWRIWSTALKEAVLSGQRDAGCAAGSWNPVDKWSPEGGRVYATALNALTLQTRVRYRLP